MLVLDWVVRPWPATVFQHGCPNNVPAMLWASDWMVSTIPWSTNTREPSACFHGPANPDRTERLSLMLSAKEEKNHRDRSDIVRILDALRRRKLSEEELVHATGLGTLSVRLVLQQCLRFDLVSVTDGRTTPKGKAELRRLKPRIPARKLRSQSMSSRCTFRGHSGDPGIVFRVGHHVVMASCRKSPSGFAGIRGRPVQDALGKSRRQLASLQRSAPLRGPSCLLAARCTLRVRSRSTCDPGPQCNLTGCGR